MVGDLRALNPKVMLVISALKNKQKLIISTLVWVDDKWTMNGKLE